MSQKVVLGCMVFTVTICVAAIASAETVQPEWCKSAPDRAMQGDNRGESTVVCVDASEPVPRLVYTVGAIDDDPTLIPPNQRIDLMVVTCGRDADVVVTTGSPADDLARTLGGTTNNLRSSDAGAVKSETPPTNQPPCVSGPRTVARYSYAARPPGAVVFTVTTKDHKDPNDKNGDKTRAPTTTITLTSNPSKLGVPTTATLEIPAATGGSGSGDNQGYRIELLVPHVYSSALRLGVSLVYGASDHSYSARKPPGGDVATIIDNGAPYVIPEITLGFAPFFDDLTRNHGRVYTHYKASPLHIAPYFGVGVLSATTGQVQWLRSLYVGFEYELFSNCSIAVAGVLRRTDGLAPNLEVGTQVGDMTTLTTSRYAGGVAIVFNFSPDFLKFAGLGLK